MIIYGIKPVHLNSEQSKTIACPSCNTQGSLTISVFRKHVHLFWIPMFPIGKKGVLQCQHCKIVIGTKGMPESVKKEYEALINQSKKPLWQFSGLVILALLIGWISYSNGENKILEKEYIISPKKGDVYEYKTSDNSYSTLKVTKVFGDSIFVSQNEYETNKMYKTYKIDKIENYSELSYVISKAELKEMYESEEIFDVNRN